MPTEAFNTLNVWELLEHGICCNQWKLLSVKVFLRGAKYIWREYANLWIKEVGYGNKGVLGWMNPALILPWLYEILLRELTGYGKQCNQIYVNSKSKAEYKDVSNSKYLAKGRFLLFLML